MRESRFILITGVEPLVAEGRSETLERKLPILLSKEANYDATKGKEGYDLNIARAQLKKVVKWGEEDCYTHQVKDKTIDNTEGIKRRDCPKCWQSLKEELD